jgi:catechol 2,3-dioxygenase-like lactoylglutathione lyase family enzyme
MPQLRRLAISVENPAKLVDFYREVFELEQISEVGGAVFLSDGVFNLALLPGQDVMATGLKGLGFETAPVESIRMKLGRTANADQSLVEHDANNGTEYEMHDPDGNLIGLRSRAFDVSSRRGPVPIRHIALYTPDPQRLADFYCQVLDMKEVERTDRSSIFVSDGYLNLALLYQRKEEPIGLNHFGFHVTSNEEMQTRAEKAGVRRGAARPNRIPFAEYRVHDPEGNGIDISQKGWHV